jgi:hypothetical protein
MEATKSSTGGQYYKLQRTLRPVDKIYCSFNDLIEDVKKEILSHLDDISFICFANAIMGPYKPLPSEQRKLTSPLQREMMKYKINLFAYFYHIGAITKETIAADACYAGRVDALQRIIEDRIGPIGSETVEAVFESEEPSIEILLALNNLDAELKRKVSDRTAYLAGKNGYIPLFICFISTNQYNPNLFESEFRELERKISDPSYSIIKETHVPYLSTLSFYGTALRQGMVDGSVRESKLAMRLYSSPTEPYIAEKAIDKSFMNDDINLFEWAMKGASNNISKINLASKAIEYDSIKVLDWLSQKYPADVTKSRITIRASLHGKLDILRKYRSPNETPKKEEIIGAVRGGHTHIIDYFITIGNIKQLLTEFLAVLAVEAQNIVMLRYLQQIGCPMGSITYNKAVEIKNQEIIEFCDTNMFDKIR